MEIAGDFGQRVLNLQQFFRHQFARGMLAQLLLRLYEMFPCLAQAIKMSASGGNSILRRRPVAEC